MEEAVLGCAHGRGHPMRGPSPPDSLSPPCPSVAPLLVLPPARLLLLPLKLAPDSALAAPSPAQTLCVPTDPFSWTRMHPRPV